MQWHIIPTGRVWLEPGGIFGLVPRPLWIEKYPLDNEQRIPMDLNSLLIRSDGKNILVDTGMGDKLSEKKLRHWGLEWPEGKLVENLTKIGLSIEDVDIVINSHLHSDHCGGNTINKGDEINPTFPNAEYWLQRMEFADAMHPNARTRNTYLNENFKLIWERNQLKLLHGDTIVTREVKCVITPGHTPGHQSVILNENDSPPIIFVADLASFAIHMTRTAWVAAYDVEPLETITTKSQMQNWAIENDALIIFQHDTQTRLGSMYRNGEGRLEIKTIQPGSLG
jgi:glyoxylase-like metal-dependent hydrolase (beta-lactamase superfamily II)